MSLKSILFSLSARKIYKLMSVVVFALFMTSMVVLSGFAALTAKAVTWQSVTVTPSSCNVGDTITVTVVGGANTNEYRYGFRITEIGGDYTIYQEWSSSSTSTYVPVVPGKYSFRIYVRDSIDSSYDYDDTSSVVVSAAESSDPESSDPESSDPESSISLPFLPSDWEGGGFVQPSAESTPDLSYEDLPSDLDAFEVNEDLTQIIGKAFNAFPQKLIVLMIPTVICLFVGWWLHK